MGRTGLGGLGVLTFLGLGSEGGAITALSSLVAVASPSLAAAFAFLGLR